MALEQCTSQGVGFITLQSMPRLRIAPFDCLLPARSNQYAAIRHWFAHINEPVEHFQLVNECRSGCFQLPLALQVSKGRVYKGLDCCNLGPAKAQSIGENQRGRESLMGRTRWRPRRRRLDSSPSFAATERCQSAPP